MAGRMLPTESIRHDVIDLQGNTAYPFGCVMRDLPMSHWFDHHAMRRKLLEMEEWRARSLAYALRSLQRIRVYYHVANAETDECPWKAYGGGDQPPLRPLVELKPQDFLIPGGVIPLSHAWGHIASRSNPQLTHLERVPMELVAYILSYLPALEDRKKIAEVSPRCWALVAIQLQTVRPVRISRLVVVAEFK